MGRPIVIAKKTADTTQDIVLHSQLANRHGLIAGATGTGKTVTLKVLAESFSRLGYPCYSPMPKAMFPAWPKQGEAIPKFDERIKKSEYRLAFLCSLTGGILGFVWRTGSSDSNYHSEIGPASTGPNTKSE